MSARPPAKEKGRRFCYRPGQRLPVGYRLLALLQAPFGKIFWLIEQRKARIQDQVANLGTDAQ